ncbi:MAG: DNA repair protein RecO [Deltaproteobacteria bacterium]|nr:DNA repair protein RecO [Deltaproteobacteria bacterium]
MAEGELGVVLKTTPLRESDLLVVLYTATHGRVAAVARGARKSQRRFAGALQLLVLGRYDVRRSRGELWSLESADVEREWTAIASDVFAVAHASYIAELVAGILPAESPEPEALDVIVGLWDSLAEAGASPAALRHVELALLELAGHMPALGSCAACGERDLESGAVFDPSRGGAICRRCAATSRGPGVRPLEPGTRAYLVEVARAGSASEARGVDERHAAGDRTAARDAMLAMVTSLVGKPLKSLEYIAKLGAAARKAP